MKIILIAFLAIFLVGCQTARPITLSRTQVTVVTPPSNLFKCKQVVLPSTNDLTNKQVADLIVQFYNANRQCGINMRAIEDFIVQAKAAAEANR